MTGPLVSPSKTLPYLLVAVFSPCYHGLGPMILIKVSVSFAGLTSFGDNLARSSAPPGFSNSTLNVTVSFLVTVTETGLPLTGTPFRVRLKLRV